MAEYIDKEELRSKLIEIVENMCTDFVISAINKCIDNVPCVNVVPMKALEQIKWERDIAIKQLKDDYNVGFCEKKNPDLVTMKHGKWVWNPHGMDWGLGAWQCSKCHNRNYNLPMDNKINPLEFSGSKYCPECGAKMDLR